MSDYVRIDRESLKDVAAWLSVAVGGNNYRATLPRAAEVALANIEASLKDDCDAPICKSPIGQYIEACVYDIDESLRLGAKPEHVLKAFKNQMTAQLGHIENLHTLATRESKYEKERRELVIANLVDEACVSRELLESVLSGDYSNFIDGMVSTDSLTQELNSRVDALKQAVQNARDLD